MSEALILNNECSTKTEQWLQHKYLTMSVTQILNKCTQILNNECSTNTKQGVQHKY